MKFDFTTKEYEKFFTYLKYIKFPIYTIRDWIIKNPSNGMILRHDVDRNPKQSLRIAEISSELGIAGTFNFRVLNNRIHEEIVVKITELGHEIGYHYEDLSIANGDMKLAIELFDKNLQMLRQFSDVKKQLCMADHYLNLTIGIYGNLQK